MVANMGLVCCIRLELAVVAFSCVKFVRGVSNLKWSDVQLVLFLLGGGDSRLNLK